MIKFFQKLFEPELYELKIYEALISESFLFVLDGMVYGVNESLGLSGAEFPESFMNIDLREKFAYIGCLEIKHKTLKIKHFDEIRLAIKNKFPEILI